jgi:Ser/Thr protein kinase RdoA (MazF antagonist)
LAPPASWIATRPTIDMAAATTALERWWGIRGDLTDLPSERDRNLLVRPADTGAARVLKIANMVEDPTLLEAQGVAMTRLAAAGVPVQRLIPARDGRPIVDLGDPGPPWARLLTWIDGRPLATVSHPSPSLLRDLGETMGRCATALLDLDLPAARRDFQWDVMRAESVVAGNLGDVPDPERRALLERTLAALRERLVPRLSGLRMSVIHNDANDHNVLVDEAGERLVGLLDFGDLVWSVTAHEAAVAATYVMFDRPEPLEALAAVVAGFDRTCPFSAEELDALPDLVLARVATSVAIAARQTRLDPDPYLGISETPAWALLARLDALPPGAARAAVASAVGR